MRGISRVARALAFVGSLCFSQVSLSDSCPTSVEIPAHINSARNFLQRITAQDRDFVSQEVLIKGLVDFIVARGKAEVRVWFIRSVVDTLCNKDRPLHDYFSTTCLVYGSPLFGHANALSEADFTALLRDIKTDATYAPACALHTRFSEVLRQATLPEVPGLGPAEIIEGIASLGYYYTAIATKATNPIEGAATFPLILKNAAGSLTIILDSATSINVPNDLRVLAAWQGMVAASTGDYSVALAQISAFLSSPGVEVPERVTTAMRTVVALTSAKDEASVTSILDSVASPLGAWAAKQSKGDDGTPTYVTSVTALPGIQIGKEKIGGAGQGVSTSSYGFFLPIGVQLSRAMFGGAVSLLLSPVDAGALVSYAEKKNVAAGTIQSTAPVTWQSIVAPGAYAAYSFHNAPFVVGIGYQRSPRLRSIELQDKSVEAVPANRLLLFFAVDVTLFMNSR